MVRFSYLDSYLHALRVALSLFIEYLHNQKYVPLAMTHAHKRIDVRHIHIRISEISIDSSREWARCARQLHNMHCLSTHIANFHVYY